MYNYYGVKKGRVPGVYENWQECQKQVVRYPNAMFKSFLSFEDAQAYVNAIDDSQDRDTAHEMQIFTDGSYCDGRYSWAFVAFQGVQEVFRDSGVGQDKDTAQLRNIAGEVMAVLEAVKWAEKNNVKLLTVNHDYSGVSAWADGSWQAKKKLTAEYAQFIQERRAWVRFKKVKGHAGIVGNEIVDKMAKEALGL